jgi:hypothetical protein
MKSKFEVGDRVKVLIGRKTMIGKLATITKITENDRDFFPKKGEEILYFIDGEEKNYSFEYFFEIDKEFNRNKKINELLDGRIS